MAPPVDAPSPTPSGAGGNKRARATGTAASGAGSGPGGGSAPSRAKRRKPEDSVGPDSEAERGQRRPMSFGLGMVKGREDEWSEPADIKTKINFLDLPVDSLYRYLELHDLLPRWDVSPWSELPCTPPNALYTIPPPPPVVPIHPSSPKRDESTMDVDPLATGGPMGAPAATEGPSGDAAAPAPGDAEPPKPVLGEDGQPLDDEAAAEAAADEENNAPPTTRSKTAPQRRPSTPEDTPPAVHIKRGVMTLSDVHAARAVLAEKANQHWMKGLGGGQNREGETIVNFLYKNKVGHGRLLRVYNPVPAPFS